MELSEKRSGRLHYEHDNYDLEVKQMKMKEIGNCEVKIKLALCDAGAVRKVRRGFAVNQFPTLQLMFRTFVANI